MPFAARIEDPDEDCAWSFTIQLWLLHDVLGWDLYKIARFLPVTEKELQGCVLAVNAYREKSERNDDFCEWAEIAIHEVNDLTSPTDPAPEAA